ncbi:MAG: LysR family transcriptional regulator, partial [Sphingomonadales bacterium]
TAAHALTRLGDGLDAAIVLSRELDPGLYSRLIARSLVVAVGARELVEGPAAIRDPDQIARATILLHRDIPHAFDIWRNALGRPDLEPAAVDHFDSGQLMLEAAAQGLGIAFMLDMHLDGAHDPRLVNLFNVEVVSTYSYWFACRRAALSNRAVKLFHDWLFEQTF